MPVAHPIAAYQDFELCMVYRGAMADPVSIHGDSIQRIYGYYISKRYLVNRRYQRKLVWTIDEKAAFIDTLLRSYPVPLILLAGVEFGGTSCFEIIDGMQRLNAITSFLENDFPIESKGYFDLESLAETKLLRDQGSLIQRTPILPRTECVALAGYNVPVSVFTEGAANNVDEVFRRINSGGRQLSPQELRQAGIVSDFSDIVRELAAKIRGDVSAHDQLLLNHMKNISITNKNLPYGINTEDIFWCAQAILTKDQVRKSQDEELIADILAYVLLDPKPASNSEILDGLYIADAISPDSKEKSRADELEAALKRSRRESIVDRFLAAFEALRTTLASSSKKFNTLMFEHAGQRVPRYFQAVFLAYYELMNADNMTVASTKKAAGSLDGIGSSIDVGKGGGRWSAKDRTKSIQAVKGILRPAFKKRTGAKSPLHEGWTLELENLLMQSTTENTLYDLKQGFCRLDTSRKFDDNVVAKLAETATAMANQGPDVAGYIVVGIADSATHARRIEQLDGIKAIRYNNFHIVGIDREVGHVGEKSIDKYLQMILQKLKTQPVDPAFAAQLARDMKNVQYAGLSVLVFEVHSGKSPSVYDGKYFERHHSNNIEVPAARFGDLFSRFQKP